MVFAAFLHVLHGNRPYALSRNSHPLTPYAPTGDFVYKNVIQHITDKIELTYKKGTSEAIRRVKPSMVTMKLFQELTARWTP